MENAISGGKQTGENLKWKVSNVGTHQNHPGNLLRDQFLVGSRKSDSVSPVINILNKFFLHSIVLDHESRLLSKDI